MRNTTIKDEYTRIVKQDKSYQLFGHPDNLYRILEPHEYEDDVAADEIDIGIETAEELLDWSSFRKFVINELKKQSNLISVRTNTEVIAIHGVFDGGYTVQSKQITGSTSTTFADIIVNASWYNIPKFNAMLGVSDVKRCNRVKAISTVSLPENMLHAPTMFFCMGAFCMFSNKGNGIGMLTYAPETNVAVSTSSDFEEEMENTFFNISDYEKRAKGQKIIHGVSKFIPKMKDAIVIKTDYGVIQTFMDEDTVDFGFQIGNLDFIHDPKRGGIFKRDYSGVSLLRSGYIVNACMKLLYCFNNAELIRDVIEKQ